MNVQTKTDCKSIIIAVLLAGFIFFGAGYVLLYLWRVFVSILEATQAALGAAVLTVLGSVAPLIYSTYKNRQREIEQALYEKKEPVYESLMNFMFDVLKKSKTDESFDEQEMIDFLMKFSKELMLWGSDDVVRAYVRWRRVTSSNPTPTVMLLALEDLFRAIRLDFGHTNKGIEKGDLLSFIITDIDETLAREE